MTSRIRPMRVRLDALEPRVLLTVEAALIAPSLPGIGQPAELADESASLREIHEVTGVDFAHRRDLRGQGQTVVVIGSGIAYDHAALGGGFGAAHRVVGGWDFAEDDANPYDDSPAGFHGTHVAGILGSADDRHLGVAPEVDMIALRVFNDQGQGRLSWLESSLRWVVDHQNAFVNPITTVNLSLGTQWNSLSLPEYATLEDELRTLREAGVFVTGAAGNRFDGDQGLSYPAISPSVTAAASWNGRDALSEFAQRHDSVFVLPGEEITSTVPDFLEDFNGVADDFYSASGTSMAAPYLAGASVLVREAMQQSGSENVSVEAIEAVLRETAQELYDSQTDEVYQVVNVEAAIRHVLGEAAPGLIQIDQHTVRVQGTRQQDTIQFKDSLIIINGERYAIDPHRIESLVFVGDGRDRIQFFPNDDHSQVTFRAQSVTIDSPRNAIRADGFSEIKVYSSGAATVATFEGDVGRDRFVSKSTHSWMQGDTFLNYIRGATRVSATTDDATDSVLFYDTKGNDQFVLSPSASTFTGANHVAVAHGFSTVGVRAHQGGRDRATLLGTNSNNVARFTPEYVSLKSSTHFAYVEGVEETTVVGNGVLDSARLFDSPGNDEFSFGVDQHHVWAGGHYNTLLGFESVQAYASTGIDRVVLTGSEHDERFTAKPTHSWMVAGHLLSSARGFDEVHFQGGGGHDIARLYDGKGIDQFSLSPNGAAVRGQHFLYFVEEISRIHAVSAHGQDSVELKDSRSRDRLYATEQGVWMTGASFVNSAEGFEHIAASSSGGHDRLMLASALAAIVSSNHDAWFLDEHDFELVVQGFAYYAAQRDMAR